MTESTDNGFELTNESPNRSYKTTLAGPGRPSLLYKLTDDGHDQFPSHFSQIILIVFIILMLNRELYDKLLLS